MTATIHDISLDVVFENIILRLPFTDYLCFVQTSWKFLRAFYGDIKMRDLYVMKSIPHQIASGDSKAMAIKYNEMKEYYEECIEKSRENKEQQGFYKEKKMFYELWATVLESSCCEDSKITDIRLSNKNFGGDVFFRMSMKLEGKELVLCEKRAVEKTIVKKIIKTIERPITGKTNGKTRESPIVGKRIKAKNNDFIHSEKKSMKTTKKTKTMKMMKTTKTIKDIIVMTPDFIGESNFAIDIWRLCSGRILTKIYLSHRFWIPESKLSLISFYDENPNEESSYNSKPWKIKGAVKIPMNKTKRQGGVESLIKKILKDEGIYSETSDIFDNYDMGKYVMGMFDWLEDELKIYALSSFNGMCIADYVKDKINSACLELKRISIEYYKNSGEKEKLTKSAVNHYDDFGSLFKGFVDGKLLHEVPPNKKELLRKFFEPIGDIEFVCKHNNVSLKTLSSFPCKLKKKRKELCVEGWKYHEVGLSDFIAMEERIQKILINRKTEGEIIREIDASFNCVCGSLVYGAVEDAKIKRHIMMNSGAVMAGENTWRNYSKETSKKSLQTFFDGVDGTDVVIILCLGSKMVGTSWIEYQENLRYMRIIRNMYYKSNIHIKNRFDGWIDSIGEKAYSHCDDNPPRTQIR